MLTRLALESEDNLTYMGRNQNKGEGGRGGGGGGGGLLILDGRDVNRNFFQIQMLSEGISYGYFESTSKQPSMSVTLNILIW